MNTTCPEAVVEKAVDDRVDETVRHGQPLPSALLIISARGSGDRGRGRSGGHVRSSAVIRETELRLRPRLKMRLRLRPRPRPRPRPRRDRNETETSSLASRLEQLWSADRMDTSRPAAADRHDKAAVPQCSLRPRHPSGDRLGTTAPTKLLDMASQWTQ